MLLSEDKFVIDALIKILSENYESLEYDEEGARGMDFLKVRKKNPTENLDFSLTADSICETLGKVTNRSFFAPIRGVMMVIVISIRIGRILIFMSLRNGSHKYFIGDRNCGGVICYVYTRLNPA